MKIDGKVLAEEIYKKVSVEIDSLTKTPRFCIISCAPNAVTQQYLRLKEARARDLGIVVETVVLDESVNTADMVGMVQKKSVIGTPLLVQLPLPPHIDTKAVLQALPVACDVDGLRFVEVDKHPYLSPVVGAISEIINRYQIPTTRKKVVVVGEGRLVGKPVVKWFEKTGVEVMVLNKATFSLDMVQTADILVSGVGVPGLIKPEMVKTGAILLDAGTSGAAGTLQGDIDPRCYQKSSFYTPVPGGIGPVTIAVLMQNVIQANKKQTIEG